ncbi:MAG: hypothetical protein ACKO1M_01075 [Planctomycetota bacterium]
MLLRLEGHRDLPNASTDDVVRAVYDMASPDGPTYLIVEDGQDTYAQAAGTDGRYVIESRTIFGEGFQHFRVARDLGGEDAPAVIHYRQKCSKHPPRRCPLRVRESEVCTFADVERALLTFAATGERDGTLFWRDVTAEMVRDFARRPDDEDEIGLITPQ